MSEPVDQAAKPDELLDEAGEQAGLTSDDAGQAAPADAGAASGAAPGSDEQIAQLKALAAERTEDLQRVHAEYVNYKRRVDRDRALARQGGIEALRRDLLPVFDSLDAGLSAAGAESGPLRDGLELTYKQLLKVATDNGLSVLDPTGEIFNPEHHQAISQAPAAGVAPGHVATVFQKGYVLNGRLLRPALVVVAND